MINLNEVSQRMRNYIETETLKDAYDLLSETEKSYAAYLVTNRHYPVSCAIEQAYMHGWDSWEFDHKTGEMVKTEFPRF